MALYAFDGTSKEDDVEDDNDSNVVRFARAYRGRRVYRSGVGTRYGALGKVFGGWMGLGLHQRIDEAKSELRKNLDRGDRVIDIIGFSRGAATALDFANVVFEEFGHSRPDAPPVRFVGLFDTVASTGILPGPVNLGLDLGLPPNVGKCCHAMALDESRASFHLCRVKPRKGAKLAPGTVEEVWFRGCHSDIGGGHQHDPLANIALCWMLRRAAHAGLQFNEEEVQAALGRRDAAAHIIRAGFDKKVKKRQPKAGDRVHCSVQPRDNHRNPPEVGCLVIDDLGDERGSYPGILPWPVPIDWGHGLMPVRRLAVGGPATLFEVFADSEWNELPHLQLEAGDTYRFEVVDGPHDWIDGEITKTNGAAGYDLPVLAPFKHLARKPDAGWFTLVGAVDRADLFTIGRQCDHTPARSGEFACFANDAPFKYANNRGRLQLSVVRIA